MAEPLPAAASPRLTHRLCAVSPGPVCARLAVRAGAAARDSVSQWFGLRLPDKPMTSLHADSRAALWLGPDEWLVLDWRDHAGANARPLAEAPEHPFSAVEISDRQVSIIVEGDAAADLLNAGSPLDLSLDVFPVGAVARTVFDRAEVIIWRQAATRFHLEVLRSMAGYVWTILELAHADIVSDPSSLASRANAAPSTDKP